MEARGLRDIRLAKLADAKRYTVNATAKVLGVSTPTYRMIERDPSRMTMLQAKTLAGHLGCQIDDLFYLPNDDN